MSAELPPPGLRFRLLLSAIAEDALRVQIPQTAGYAATGAGPLALAHVRRRLPERFTLSKLLGRVRLARNATFSLLQEILRSIQRQRRCGRSQQAAQARRHHEHRPTIRSHPPLGAMRNSASVQCELPCVRPQQRRRRTVRFFFLRHSLRTPPRQNHGGNVGQNIARRHQPSGRARSGTTAQCRQGRSSHWEPSPNTADDSPRRSRTRAHRQFRS